MATAVMIQVRLGSTRLKNKALLKINNIEMIIYSLRACNKINVDEKIVVTEQKSYNTLKSVIAKYSDLKNYKIFVGDEKNVLSRFIDCARKYNIDLIIRATGDNPLISYEYANHSLKYKEYDYFTFKGMPIGTGVELVKSDALLRASKELSFLEGTDEYNYCIEHVCPYLYQNKDKFKVKYKEVDFKSNLSVTVDTEEDFIKVKSIICKLKTDTIKELLNLS